MAADLDRMQRALVAADAAGDTESAKALAAAIRAASPQPAKPPEKMGFMDALTGDLKDIGGAIYNQAKSVFTAPGDAMAGKFNALSDEGRGRALEFATSVSPMNPAVRAGDRAIPGVLKNAVAKKPQVPTQQELKAAADSGYTRARDSGVEYPADAVKGMADSLRADLEGKGVIAELSPKTFTILDKLGNPPAGATANISGLDAARRAFGHAGGDFTNPTEQMAAGRGAKAIDDFVSGYRPQGLLDQAAPAEGSGLLGAADPYAQVSSLITDARGNTAALKRSERVTKAQDLADLNASAANSGQNLDNATRQRIKAILANPKQARGYSPEELDAMRKVVEGTTLGNGARILGNMMGGGGGLGATVAGGMAGAAAGGAEGGLSGLAIGAGVPAIGYGLRKYASGVSQRGVNNLDEMIRKRSPLYQQRVANPGTQADSYPMSALMARLLIAAGIDPNNMQGQSP